MFEKKTLPHSLVVVVSLLSRMEIAADLVDRQVGWARQSAVHPPSGGCFLLPSLLHLTFTTSSLVSLGDLDPSGLQFIGISRLSFFFLFYEADDLPC